MERRSELGAGTTMKSLIGFGLAAILTLVGCDMGAQKGKFTASGTGSITLDNDCGNLIAVRGASTSVDPMLQSSQPLLYVLVLVPGFHATGSGDGGSNLTYISTVKWNYSNAAERIEGELSWNRDNEQVSVGGARFDRSKGQAFVVIRGKDGKWTASQVALKSAKSKMEALEEIQKSLPADSPAKNVKLHKSADMDPRK